MGVAYNKRLVYRREVTIQLELIDEVGKLILDPFNKVNRTVTLTK